MKKYDVLIVGAGPVGLCFAASLAGIGLKIAVVEKQSRAILSDPHCDGRDVALTHSSKKILMDLGVWQYISNDSVSEIKKAKVINGTSLEGLEFNPSDVGQTALGFLVSNHLIRKAVFENMQHLANISLITEVTALDAYTDDTSATIELSNGEILKGDLLVAADSRFSQIRQKMGLSARMQDFGRLIIVWEMEIEKSHDQTAYECFQYGQTLAVLPLRGDKCSIVMTICPHEGNRFIKMPPEQFNAEIEQFFSSKYGKMTLIGDRHSYPLVSTYADQFVGKRFALIGDAAVGMHPVTAHGFNFGLSGQKNLADEIKNAASLGCSIASKDLLTRYEREHKKRTKPLYLMTNSIAKLFTNDAPTFRRIRGVLLKVANRASPIKKILLSALTEKSINKTS